MPVLLTVVARVRASWPTQAVAPMDRAAASVCLHAAQRACDLRSCLPSVSSALRAARRSPLRGTESRLYRPRVDASQCDTIAMHAPAAQWSLGELTGYYALVSRAPVPWYISRACVALKAECWRDYFSSAIELA